VYDAFDHTDGEWAVDFEKLPTWAAHKLNEFVLDKYGLAMAGDVIGYALDANGETEDFLYEFELGEYSPDYDWLVSDQSRKEFCNRAIDEYETKDIDKAVLFGKTIEAGDILWSLCHDLWEACGSPIALAKWRAENE
jgi:hypothetical protein